MKKHLGKVLLAVVGVLLIAWCYLPKQSFVNAEDIEFSRCSCDSAMYCLNDEQYTVIIAQLSARENKGE
jgi:hypothetical protein